MVLPVGTGGQKSLWPFSPKGQILVRQKDIGGADIIGGVSIGNVHRRKQQNIAFAEKETKKHFDCAKTICQYRKWYCWSSQPLKPVQAAGESFEADEMAKALVTLQH